MNKKALSFLRTVLIFALVLLLAHFFPSLFSGVEQNATGAATAETIRVESDQTPQAAPDEDGEYDDRDTLALYIHLYGHLPSNFVTKAEAEAAGWTGGGLEKILPGKSIGGDRFGNREGLLPREKGRVWIECDVNTRGKSDRGPERIVFSNDGLIYYTADHYDSFTCLYGEG